MDQIRAILQQLALHLDLNIAMCDMIEDHNKRIAKLEAQGAAQKVSIEAMRKQVSELQYSLASSSYESRRGSGKT